MVDLKGKTIVVPGASGGMGRELCKLLAEEGARLAISSNDELQLKDLEAALKKKGCEVISMVIDVTSENDVGAFFQMVGASYGKADILVNLPGLSIPARIADMSVDQYDLTMDVNLKGTFLCSKHFIRLVGADEGGQIINIGSMASKRANPNAPLYCTAKAAVNMFSQGLALQLIEKKIRVTTLNPGPTDTAFWGDRPMTSEKFMKPSDVAEVNLFVMKMTPAVVIH